MEKTIYTEYILVTPTMAKEYLLRNNNNRGLRMHIVKEQASAIKRGEWITTHQGVALSKSGNLLDGQHRLRAIVESGIAITIAVTHNIDDESFKAIDCGLSRNLHERTSITPRYAEVVSSLYRIINSTRYRLSADQALEFFNEHKDNIVQLHEYCGTMTKGFTVSPMRAALVVMMYKNKDFALNTYRNLVLGNIDEVSDLTKYFLKQILVGNINLQLSGSGQQAQNRSFMIGMRLFDKDYENNKRFNFNDQSFDEAKHKAQGLIKFYKKAA